MTSARTVSHYHMGRGPPMSVKKTKVLLGAELSKRKKKLFLSFLARFIGLFKTSLLSCTLYFTVSAQ